MYCTFPPLMFIHQLEILYNSRILNLTGKAEENRHAVTIIKNYMLSVDIYPKMLLEKRTLNITIYVNQDVQEIWKIYEDRLIIIIIPFTGLAEENRLFKK